MEDENDEIVLSASNLRLSTVLQENFSGKVDEIFRDQDISLNHLLLQQAPYLYGLKYRGSIIHYADRIWVSRLSLRTLKYDLGETLKVLKI